jgi:tetratricopeptide (TPR) repeat protein
MFENKDDNQDVLNKVALFEEMINQKSFTFFDVDDFELIIDYYLSVDFSSKAGKALKMGLSQYPNDLALVLLKVDLLNSSQKFSESFSILKDIEHLFPNNIDITIAIGKLASILDFPLVAENYIDQAFSLSALDNESKEILSDIAYEYLQLRLHNKAVNVMKEILSRDPNNETTLLEIGVAFHESNQLEESITYFNYIIDENPYSYLAWFNLGTVYNAKEMWNDAMFSFDMCLVINEEFTAAHYGKASSYIQLKEYQNAIDTFNESFQFDHPHSFAYCSIGECYEKLGEFPKAIMFYEKSLEIDDSQSDAWIGIGVVRDLINEPLEAKKFMNKALKLEPDNAEYWYIYAELLTKIGLKDEAEMAFKKVVELDPKNIDAWIDYSNFLFDNDSKNKAIDEVQRAIKKNKNQKDLHLRLVAMQIAEGNLVDAKTNLVSLQNNAKISCEQLFEIYPEAKNIPEISSVIELYNNKES